MRVFSRYLFSVGSCSIAEMMARLDAFLHDEGLHYDRMDYHIRELCPEYNKNLKIMMAKELRIIPRRKDATILDIRDLLIDYPQFGSLEKAKVGAIVTSFGRIKSTSATEQDIREVAKRVPVPYFLDEVLFFYSDIDFFREDHGTEKKSVKILDRDSSSALGSYISFEYSVFGSKSIKLCLMAEITAKEGIYNADHYAQALSQRVNRKYRKETLAYMTEEERVEYIRLNELASPSYKEIQAFLDIVKDRYPQETDLDSKRGMYTKFISAGDIKKIARGYGYTEYGYCSACIHTVSKRIDGGHYLRLSIDTPPRYNEMRLYASLIGVGFDHRFQLQDAYVYDNSIAKSILITAFTALEEVEDKIKKLAGIYPPTPEWFEIDPSV